MRTVRLVIAAAAADDSLLGAKLQRNAGGDVVSAISQVAHQRGN